MRNHNPLVPCWRIMPVDALKNQVNKKHKEEERKHSWVAAWWWASFSWWWLYDPLWGYDGKVLFAMDRQNSYFENLLWKGLATQNHGHILPVPYCKQIIRMTTHLHNLILLQFFSSHSNGEWTDIMTMEFNRKKTQWWIQQIKHPIGVVVVVVRIDCLFAWFLEFFLKELFQTCLDTYRCKLRTFKVVISCREIGFCSILQSLHQIQPAVFSSLPQHLGAGWEVWGKCAIETAPQRQREREIFTL